MINILLVEDSDEYSLLVVKTLSDYRTTCARTVDEASMALRNSEFDLVLLDIGLPGKNGYTLLAEIQARQEGPGLPVICLSARSEVSDKVTAFSLGADDYIVKPFDPIELRARVKARLAKVRKRPSELIVTVGDLKIDYGRYRVTLKQKTEVSEVELTPTEFKLLWSLVRRPDFVLSRDQLLTAAWGQDTHVLDRVIDKHLSTLRKKLGAYAQHIKCIPGVGYKFTNPIAMKRSASNEASEASTTKKPRRLSDKTF